MLTRLRTRFGTAGLIVAIVALVAAVGGTALAASGALTGKQKKEVTKIAKKYAGAPGAAGPAGPAGAKGDAGAAGANGKDGTNGTNGTNGVSPVGTAFAGAKGACTEGGVEFKGANTTVACNGVKGQTGFTDTLPSGKTETGVFAIFAHAAEVVYQSLSFNIPLAQPPLEIVYLKPGEEDETKCPQGDINAPHAAPGYICVFVAGQIFDPVDEPEGINRASSLDHVFAAGVTMGFAANAPFTALYGTWAVTAE
jgi:hypothetical protein